MLLPTNYKVSVLYRISIHRVRSSQCVIPKTPHTLCPYYVYHPLVTWTRHIMMIRVLCTSTYKTIFSLFEECIIFNVCAVPQRKNEQRFWNIMYVEENVRGGPQDFSPSGHYMCVVLCTAQSIVRAVRPLIPAVPNNRTYRSIYWRG